MNRICNEASYNDMWFILKNFEEEEEEEEEEDDDDDDDDDILTQYFVNNH